MDARCHTIKDMMRINEMLEDEPDWNQWNKSNYDVENMKQDFANGNFSENEAENYLHKNIVLCSIENGQFTQAKAQCELYGLDYSKFKK